MPIFSVRTYITGISYHVIASRSKRCRRDRPCHALLCTVVGMASCNAVSLNTLSAQEYHQFVPLMCTELTFLNSNLEQLRRF